MKKISLVLFALLGEATNVFASYGDYSYSSSSSDGLLEFLGVLMLIWGLLEIILFFKVWGMTNDIKAIKKGYFNETDYHGVDESMIKSLRTDLILGNTDEAKKTLLKYFVDKIESSFGSLPTGGFETLANGNSQYVSYGEKNMQRSISAYVEMLKKQFDKINEPVPDFIMTMKTYRDYFSLFVKKDFEVQLNNEGK
jgi:hypothetical protein